MTDIVFPNPGVFAWYSPGNTSEGYSCDVHSGAAMYGYLHFNYGDSRRCYSSDLGVDCYFYKMVFADGREENWEQCSLA